MHIYIYNHLMAVLEELAYKVLLLAAAEVHRNEAHKFSRQSHLCERGLDGCIHENVIKDDPNL
jgi:hypothetical protein